jgi:hypothetical protein
MNTPDPAQADTLVSERVQPDGPLSGAVKRGGAKRSKRRREVYFVQAGEGGLVKIGVADDAMIRLRGLATMSPVPLRLIGLMVCRKGGELEGLMHFMFHGHRRHGEWFEPVDALLAVTDRVGWRRPHRIVDIQAVLDREGRRGHKGAGPIDGMNERERYALGLALKRAAATRVAARYKRLAEQGVCDAYEVTSRGCTATTAELSHGRPIPHFDPTWTTGFLTHVINQELLRPVA